MINANDRFEVHAYAASWSTNPMGRGVFIRETWSVREIWGTRTAIDIVYLFNFFITISANRHLIKFGHSTFCPRRSNVTNVTNACYEL